MRYTVRYCHLKNIPKCEKNSLVYTGDQIGVMGNSGASTATHLHIDCVEGFMPSVYYLYQMTNRELVPAEKQLNYFIDKELFKTDIHITSYYNDPEYMEITGKLHPAYDVVPLNRHETEENHIIYWNRSMMGEVLSVGAHSDYGNYIHIGFYT